MVDLVRRGRPGLLSYLPERAVRPLFRAAGCLGLLRQQLLSGPDERIAVVEVLALANRRSHRFAAATYNRVAGLAGAIGPSAAAASKCFSRFIKLC